MKAFLFKLIPPTFLFLGLSLFSPIGFSEAGRVSEFLEINTKQKIDLIFYNTMKNLEKFDTRKEKINSLIDAMFEIKKISENDEGFQSKKDKKHMKLRSQSLEEILKKEIQIGLL